MGFLDKFLGRGKPPEMSDANQEEPEGEKPLLGSYVAVKRSSGETETDWLLLAYDEAGGGAVVAKYNPQQHPEETFWRKTIQRKDFFAANEGQITQPGRKPFPAVGDTVRITDPATRKIESDWTLLGFNPTSGEAVAGRYDQRERKVAQRNVAREKFLELNKSPEKENFKIEIGADSYGHHQPNEDDFRYSREDGFAAVCDGVSTASDSAAASRIVAEAMKGYLANISPETSAETMQKNVYNAMVRTIGELAATAVGHPGSERMATTLSMVKFAENGKKIIIGQVGDSRVCLLRQGKLHRISPEDSDVGILMEFGIITSDEDVNQEIDLKQLENLYAKHRGTGTEAERKIASALDWTTRTKNQEGKATVGNLRAVITQTMSPHSQIEPHILVYDVMPEDEFVLTTDGVHDNLIDAEMAEAIIGEKSAEGKARKLVSKARARMNDKNHPRAKPDDATAVVINA